MNKITWIKRPSVTRSGKSFWTTNINNTRIAVLQSFLTGSWMWECRWKSSDAIFPDAAGAKRDAERFATTELPKLSSPVS